TGEAPAKDWAVKDLLQAARTLGFNGLNVTDARKLDVLECLDEVVERVAKIGAVITVVIRDGKVYGYDTDVTGIVHGLEQGLPDARMDNVVQVGGGGAGNALAHSVIAAGAKNLFVADLDPERALQLADKVTASSPREGGTFTVAG